MLRLIKHYNKTRNSLYESQRGIKADMAGTALRSTLTRLSAPPKPAASAIEELGLKVTDSTGRMRPLADIIGQINEKTKDYTETEQIRIAKVT